MDNIDGRVLDLPLQDSLQFSTLFGLVKDQSKAKNLYQKLKDIGQEEFKESKARDGNGELSIVWHGSPRIFDKFDPSARGEFRWRNTGMHFSTSKDLVTQFSEKATHSFRVAFHDIGKEEIGTDLYDHTNSDHLRIAAEAYNKLIEDLIQNGEQSSYYKSHGSWGSVEYKNRGMDMEWFGEMFGGGLPTQDNVVKVKGPGGTSVYFGKDIGKVYYAVVLNIQSPFFPKVSSDLDWSFEKGEESHKNNGTDGTIIHHPQNIITRLSEIKGTAGTTSYAVFDSTDIKIIGLEVNGNFQLAPEFIVV